MRAGQAEILELVAAAESVLLPATVIGELEGAFELGRRARDNRVALSAFLEEPFVSVLPVTRDVARRYGQIYAMQRRAGAAVPVNDMWIAAAALDCGGHLVTFDRDFRRIAGLDCTVLQASAT
jgi:tRNA(fMet)-specific endonuclease VapC